MSKKEVPIHHPRHEPAGVDEINDIDISNTGVLLSTHKSRHVTSGLDQFVAGDLLNATARIAVRKNSGIVDVGTRRRLNFVEGVNTTLTVADDPANEEIDITIAAAGGTGTGTDTSQFFPASDPTSNIGTYPSMPMLDSATTTIRQSFIIPHNVSLITQASLIIVTAGTGNMRWEAVTNYAEICANENYNTHTDTIAVKDNLCTINKVTCLDITPALTGAKARDIVSIAFTRYGAHANDTINTTVHFLGIYIEEGTPLIVGLTHTIWKTGSTYYVRDESTGIVTGNTNFETLFEATFQSNRVIQMMPAIYYVWSTGGLTLTAKTNVKVYGASGVIIRQALTAPAQPVILIEQPSCTYIDWYDVTFDQDYMNPNHLPPTSYGMNFLLKPGNNGSDNSFTRCAFLNATGCFLTCGSPGVPASNMHFHECIFDHCGEHVFYVTLVTGLEVTDCYVYNWAKHGRGFAFKMTACTNATVTNTWFEPNEDGAGFPASGFISDPACGVYGPVIMDYTINVNFTNCDFFNTDLVCSRRVGLRLADGSLPVDNIVFTNCDFTKLGAGPVIDPGLQAAHNSSELTMPGCTWTP